MPNIIRGGGGGGKKVAKPTINLVSVAVPNVTFTIKNNENDNVLAYYGLNTVNDISATTSIISSATSSNLTLSGISYLTEYSIKSFAKSYNKMPSSVETLVFTTGEPPSTGQQAYTSPGTYTWVAPVGITSISVVCIGAGAPGQNSPEAGGGGGGLGWKNNISVVPGNSYTVVVGAGNTSTGSSIGSAGTSYFINTSTVAGFGGNSNRTGGGYVGDGGGNGGQGGAGFSDGIEPGGGGAGGYSGTGGRGGDTNTTPTAGSGGGGGGGGRGDLTGGGGGGTDIFGQGSNGSAGSNAGSHGIGGGGGSGGTAGKTGAFDGDTVWGGNYGGGSYGRFGNGGTSVGAGGAVRIIWGPNRAFPSTNTVDQ
jgi:hypothetical protein